MTTPQFRIDLLNEILQSEDIDLLRDDLAFGVARCIVEYNDPDLLLKFPKWVGELVHEMCAMYRRDGNYGIVSNLGHADHTAMVRKLASLVQDLSPSGSTPPIEIDRLNAALQEDNIEFPLIRRSLAFSAARCIVEYHDPHLLQKLPPWVSDMVLEMCETYEQIGSYRIVSNLGEADHSEMVRKLSEILKPRQ